MKAMWEERKERRGEDETTKESYSAGEVGEARVEEMLDLLANTWGKYRDDRDSARSSVQLWEEEKDRGEIDERMNFIIISKRTKTRTGGDSREETGGRESSAERGETSAQAATGALAHETKGKETAKATTEKKKKTEGRVMTHGRRWTEEDFEKMSGNFGFPVWKLEGRMASECGKKSAGKSQSQSQSRSAPERRKDKKGDG